MRRRFSIQLIALFAAATTLSACSNSREFELRGQVVAVNPERQELTIKHEDIRGFMPAMTMPFKVRQRRLLDGRTVGDLVKATLVVEESDAYLSTVERTGHAPLSEPPPPASPTRMIEPGTEVAGVTLTDQNGNSRQLSEWRGKVVAVTFIYTRCPLPNFCPLMDRHFASVQEALERDPSLGERAHLLSVSFDPAFDTPAVLREHATKSGANPARWTFATGERAAIDGFASQFGVSILREQASAAEILHNLRTAVIGPDGRLVTVLSGNEWKPEHLLEAMRRARD